VVHARRQSRIHHRRGSGRGTGPRHPHGLRGADIVGAGALTEADTASYAMATREDLDETKVLVEKTGRRAILSRADVRGPDGCSAAVTSGVSELGRLDIVCQRWRHARRAIDLADLRRAVPGRHRHQFETVCPTRWPSPFRRCGPPATAVRSSSPPPRRRCGSACISAATRRPRLVFSPDKNLG
jgi:hypothetical protein